MNNQHICWYSLKFHRSFRHRKYGRHGRYHGDGQYHLITRFSHLGPMKRFLGRATSHHEHGQGDVKNRKNIPSSQISQKWRGIPIRDHGQQSCHKVSDARMQKNVQRASLVATSSGVISGDRSFGRLIGQQLLFQPISQLNKDYKYFITFFIVKYVNLLIFPF